jgi:hypothetical protein
MLGVWPLAKRFINLELWILLTVVRNPFTGYHAVTRPLPAQENMKYKINVNRYQFYQLDSNPRYQCLNVRRHWMS